MIQSRTLRPSGHVLERNPVNVMPSVLRSLRGSIADIRIALLAAVLFALAAGCSGESGESSDVPKSSGPGTPSETPLPESPVVEFTDDGFQPQRLEIPVGRQVVFVNGSGLKLWPASNIHPTHEILSEFDAGQLLRAGESWAFTFHSPGFWRYHNHADPQHSGLIVARGGDLAARPPPLQVDTSQLEFAKAPQLTPKALGDLFTNDVLLRQYIEDYGPAETMSLVAEAGDVVGELCHERAHETGRMTYELFGAAAFALSSHECEAGAYHGATEAMFKSRGTANLEEDVRTICGGAGVFFYKLQCIHGVGHGLMAWTSYELYDALDLCDRLESDRDQRACYSGVFMENVVGGLSGTMGHFTDYLSDDDPHYPCNALTQRYVGPCYLYHSTRMLMLFDYDYEHVAQECANAHPAALYDCFESYGRDVAAVTLGNPKRGLSMCQDTVDDPTHRVWCIQGSVQARFWEPEKADEAIEMCSIATVAEEKNGCYLMIITRARELVSDRPTLEDFCARLEVGYEAWCER